MDAGLEQALLSALSIRRIYTSGRSSGEAELDLVAP